MLRNSGILGVYPYEFELFIWCNLLHISAMFMGILFYYPLQNSQTASCMANRLLCLFCKSEYASGTSVDVNGTFVSNYKH